MCKKYNVLDARKRVFFTVMELLEKAGAESALPEPHRQERKQGGKPV